MHCCAKDNEYAMLRRLRRIVRMFKEMETDESEDLRRTLLRKIKHSQYAKDCPDIRYDNLEIFESHFKEKEVCKESTMMSQAA